MKPELLVLLTDEDWRLMTERATIRHFEKDGVALQEGTESRTLNFVQSGYLQVVRDFHGLQLTVARLGPGEVFGEMSFLERAPAIASIVADGPAEVLTLPEQDIESLLSSVPGLALRLYQSLAITLSHRLRRAGDTGADSIGSTRMARTGFATERQLPPGLIQTVDGIKQGLQQIERQLRSRNLPAEQAAAAVAGACDAVCATLERFTQDEVVVDAGMADLLSFRDSEAVRAGIGAYVFRETFSVLMASALVSRTFAMPRGFPDDWETIAAIHGNEPAGDGQLGPLVDRWFLQRPLCAARRSSATTVTGLLASGLGDGPVAITCLAAGSCHEILELLGSARSGKLSATCVDLDERALLAAAERAEDLGCSEHITFQLGNAVPAENGEQLLLPPQHAIFAVGLFEYLGDDAALRLLDWTHRQLQSGGRAIFTNLAAGNPDSLFMEYLLECKVHHRSAEAFTELFRRSSFGGATVTAAAGGADLLALATRA
ncbi:MAG: cyclic nucleotide-binding protein [Nevskia sp.]|nr:cyclic nucleotide-binding protein [Nevskia sp.]